MYIYMHNIIIVYINIAYKIMLIYYIIYNNVYFYIFYIYILYIYECDPFGRC